jgi:Protein of unknown function (DUF2934)
MDTLEDTLEERIRARAYELWEHAGRTGDPLDHWLKAERELTGGSQDRPAKAVLRKMFDKLRVRVRHQGRCQTSGTDRIQVDR